MAHSPASHSDIEGGATASDGAPENGAPAPGSTIFDLDSPESGYDPFDADDEDIDDTDMDEETAPQSFEAAMLEHRPAAPHAEADARTPDQRLHDLLEESNDQRPTLLAILSLCRTATPVGEANGRIDAWRAENRTVYSAANLCSLLERAGGLERVDAAGRPYGEAGQNQPAVVEVGGVEYYEPTRAPQVFWRTTEAGSRAVDEDDPWQRLLDLLDAEPGVAELYRRVLLMGARGGGASAADLSSVVDMDPLAQDPVLTAPHFSVALKRCGAMRFDGAWRTTPLGLRALEELFACGPDELAGSIAAVEAAAVPVPPPEPGAAEADDPFYIGD